MTERTVLFNDNWKFRLFPVDTGYDTASKADFTDDVEIPHDWLIYDTENLYKSGEGWYKKTFEYKKDGRLCSIDFDGVYMDSTVYVNGVEAGTWRHGYASFSYDMTDLLTDGENTVMVQVRYTAPNSRWYSGAGIFRNVYITKTAPMHIARDGVYISADGESGAVTVTVEAVGEYDSVRHTVYDMDGQVCGDFSGEEYALADYKKWSVDTPYLYTLKTELIAGGDTVDEVENVFGFRTIKFDPDEGFFLNGEYMKLKGVCLHHDLGALGAAVNYRATERQIQLMKKMGVNAIRTSHNMPSRELVDICDRLGMLMDSESFDMWELSKTEFDNARFFKDTAHADVASWVRRDRNHPCVIMWSIGNEIYDTHASDHGYEIAEMLRDYVLEYDPRGNALPTIASNYIEWERAQKIGEMLGISGYNYTERCYDHHHKKYPDTVIYGSETSSAVRSRGIYHFPADIPLLTHDDHQCSSLANCCVSWGRPAEDAWIKDRDRKFCAGQFIWTGIDYIGEPTPYSTKNSYFGAVDTAGIPKDIYYFYQSVWTDVKTAPMIHLLPYWDFNEGQLIDVIAYTNAPAAELFLNGTSLGIQKIDHINGDKLHAHWQVPYEKGELTVNALDENGNVIASDVQKSFSDPVRLCISADKRRISADGRDLCFLEIYTVDKDGTFVANARNRVKLEISGGRILGMDNGDSTDYEQYKTDNRRLFSGELTAIIAADGNSGEIHVKAVSEGLESAEVYVKALDYTPAEGTAMPVKVKYLTEYNRDIPVRKLELLSQDKIKLDKNSISTEISCKIYPENATYSDIICKVVKANSVEANFADAIYENGTVKITAKGDGEGFVRVYAHNGSEYPQVISDAAISVSGLGEAISDPYTKMIVAAAYSFSSIPVNVINDGALGGFTQPCSFGFNNIDFGAAGTDVIRLYIGNSANRDIPVRIYLGDASEDNLVYTAMFAHNNGWDRPYPAEFSLPCTIKGVKTLTFAIDDNCIFGGFEFIPNEKAYAKLNAADSDKIYGDDFAVNGCCVENIGNNVVLDFGIMDFTDGTERLVICGRTPNSVNTIQLRYVENGVNKTQLLEFEQAYEYTEKVFAIDKICGKAEVSFMFMPGSKFDFESFRFERA